MAPTIWNASHIGNFDTDHRAFFQYRDQWRNITTPYKTYAMAYDKRFKTKKRRNDFLGMGISAFCDKAGDLHMGTSQVNIGIAYHKELIPYHIFSFGFQGGFRQYTINFDNVKWGSQFNGTRYDPTLPDKNNFFNQAFTVADFNAGTQWNYIPDEGITLNAGLAVHNLNKPSSSFFDPVKRSFRKLVSHASSEIEVANSNTTFIPKIFVVMQGPSREIVAGCLVKYQLSASSKYTAFQKESSVYLGAFYRYRDAVALVMNYEYGNFGFGISYDVCVSSLNTRGTGGLELSLKYIGSFDSKYYSKN